MVLILKGENCSTLRAEKPSFKSNGKLSRFFKYKKSAYKPDPKCSLGILKEFCNKETFCGKHSFSFKRHS